MRTSRTILTAIVISMAAHTVFFASSPFMVLSGMYEALDRTKKMFRVNEVSKDVKRVFEGRKDRSRSLRMSGEDPGEVLAFRDMAMEAGPSEEINNSKKKEEMIREADTILPEKQEVFDPGESLLKAAEKESKEAAPVRRTLVKELTPADIVSSGDPVEDILTVMKAEPVSAESEIAGPFRDDSGEWDPGKAGTFSPTGHVSPLKSGRIREYEDIGDLLGHDVEVYTDPATGEKYFRIQLAVTMAGKLPVMPKEVIILIDSSKSMTPEKLEYVKEGVIAVLDDLNRGDRFNIVAFRGSIIMFEDRSVPVTAKTISRAKSYVRDLEAVGQTDVENALLGIIESPVTYEPSYIMLVSDGRPTAGVTDSRKIIQQITRDNERVRPIFCFGGGRRVNRYLLDFISYQNRGWSRFSQDTYAMAREFQVFYDEIRDPLLMNVRYRMTGVDTGKVYPKHLSDLYEGRPFVLLGRYGEEKEFSVQLLGEMDGATKEIIFRADLRNASRGGSDIAREWAFRKMYYLISVMTMGEGDPMAIRKKIDAISRKYGIRTPYDVEDED